MARQPTVAPAPAVRKPALHHWAGHRVTRWLGSLQVAVIALSVLIVVLAAGTQIEASYTGRLAQDLVYQTWWFQGLLGLLFVNILFAALKKWPWKQHQLGFLVTHLGLLLLIVGGVMNGFGGTDALLSLVASDDSEKYGAYAPQASSVAHFADDATIAIKVGDKAEPTTFPFDPGLLPWRADKYFTPRPDPVLGTLAAVAHPLPRAWSRTANGVTVEVLNFYPHARPEPYRAAGDGERGSPAAKVRFSLSPPGGAEQTLPDEWLGDGATDPRLPLKADLLPTARTDGHVEEFLRPPPLATLGSRGQLALWFDGDLTRLKLDRDDAVPLGKTGWSVRVARFYESLPNREIRGPVAQFEFKHTDGRTANGFAAGSRPMLDVLAGEGGDRPTVAELQRRASGWLHVDPRLGRQANGVVQLLPDAADKLHYRSFNRVEGVGFELETSGELPTDPTAPGVKVLGNVRGSLKLVEYLPRAVRKRRYVPEARRPGLEAASVGLEPVIRCRVSKGGESEELWVNKTIGDTSYRVTTLGGDRVAVGFHMKTVDLGFTLKLQRAEQTGDPGTQAAATYTSYVLLDDPKAGLNREPRVITMNEPLDHRGMKFYQSGLNTSLPRDDDGRPVALSTFTVGRDPGLGLKYAGSVMLAVGIALMFWMKAYTVAGMKRYWGGVVGRRAGATPGNESGASDGRQPDVVR